MEQFCDGQACRVYHNSSKGWSSAPSWDDLTEDQRQVYRDFVNRMPFREHDPKLSERYTP